MGWETYLRQERERCPNMEPADAAKLCYQAARGGEHLLTDPQGARRYFDREFEAVPPREGPMCVPISRETSRVDLGAWKGEGLPGAWLFGLFQASAALEQGGEERLRELLDAADRVLTDLPGWAEFAARYRAAGMPSLHHSAAYRAAYGPAYRLVDARFLRLLPVLQWAAGRSGGVIAIDGRAGSGKTVLAECLAQILGAGLVRMDDFFLPAGLRTPERLAEPGGNLHRERFSREVLPHLKGGGAFSYGVFDCGKMAVNGVRTVPPSPWRVVEGTYSHHPAFGAYADLTVFSLVEPEEQRRRILRREGTERARRYEDLWIPMEEAYFARYRIADRADLRI